MHTLSRSAAAAIAVAALTAPAAHAQGQLTPDARDAATGWHGGRPYQNPGSPDAQDAARGVGTYSAPEVTILKVPQPAAQPSGGGIDWADVGIGAGGVLGVVLLAGGGAALMAHRREMAVR
jgi:hypothetical protein